MIEYFLLAFGSLFAIIDPIAGVPAFLAMTFENSRKERLRMVKVASLTAMGVLLAFAFLGRYIFRIFGISMPAFQIAGGIILLLVSLDMLRAKRSRVLETAEEKREGAGKTDIAITPLAIPMLAGPGAISTVTVLSGQADTLLKQLLLAAAIIAAGSASYYTLMLSTRGAKWLNRTVMNIITRLMGLLLAAIAVQFIGSALPNFIGR